MAVSFSVPSGPTMHHMSIETFRGVDLYNDGANVDLSRSPEAPNMIRDEVGNVRKRMGYRTIHQFPDKINGLFTLNENRVIHSGTKLFVERHPRSIVAEDPFGVSTQDLEDLQPEIPPGGDGDDTPADTADEVPYNPEDESQEAKQYEEVFSGLADNLSWGAQFGNKLYLLDGVEFWAFDGKTVEAVQGTVPTVLIAKKPSGGGVRHQPFNLLSDCWAESFHRDAERKFHLHTGNLEKIEEVQVALPNGEWKILTETEYEADLVNGVVEITAPITESPVAGVDDVKITVRKTQKNRSRVTKCTTGVLYGVNGAQDRLFLTGNPKLPNLDFYSEFDDPTFFGDENYGQLGKDDGKIMGYSVVGNSLVAHRAGASDGQSIIVRTGTMDSAGKVAFPITNTIHGEPAASPRAFGTLDEPLFLTALGVYAITPQELTGEKYSQQRSLYLDGAFRGVDKQYFKRGDQPAINETLEKAVAVVWQDFYVLALKGNLYLLDGKQKSYAKDAPQSAFQYEGYYWTEIPARVLLSQRGRLLFGTEDGRLCKFWDEPDNPESYNDDGAPIRAYWDTPDLDGQSFWKNKTFRYVACRIASAVLTGVKIFAQVRGLWRQIYDAGAKARYFDWGYVDFSKFVFSADRTPRTLGGKIKLKKVDKVRFRFENAELNEPFGLYAIGFEYTEPGARYKG